MKNPSKAQGKSALKPDPAANYDDWLRGSYMLKERVTIFPFPGTDMILYSSTVTNTMINPNTTLINSSRTVAIMTRNILSTDRAFVTHH